MTPNVQTPVRSGCVRWHCDNERECAKHIEKRMGTALRNLTKEKKKTGVTLGGRGHDKLTHGVIDKLTYYYGNPYEAALETLMPCAMQSSPRSFTPSQRMKTLTMTAVQSALAAGASSRKHVQREKCQEHTKDNIKIPLSRDIAEEVKDVYVRLGHPDLLRRCLTGGTQNDNESLHAKVWAKCPKTGVVGLQHVIAATCSATAKFNQGFESVVARSYGEEGGQPHNGICRQGRR